MSYSKAFVITPDDSAEVSADAFLVETDGTIAVQMINGDAIELPVVAGIIYPIGVRRVLSTGTSGVGDVIGFV